MILLDLPCEVLLEILVAAVYSRGLARALRLRLVCKEFSRLVNDALFATDLLDKYASTNGIHRSRSEENALPFEYFSFWQSYLFHRLQNPARRLSKRLAFIQTAAQGYCRRAGTADEHTFRQCLWALSDPRIQVGTQELLQDSTTSPTYPGQPGPEDELRAILVAAVCLNNGEMAQSILDGWPANKRIWMTGPFPQSAQFQSAIYVAARFARNDIVRIFYTHPSYQMIPTPFWYGCGMGGDIETLNIFFEKNPPECFRFRRFFRLSAWPVSALCQTSHPDVYDWLRIMYKRREGESGPDDPFATSAQNGGLGEQMLALSASAGHLNTMEHLIQLGVPVNPGGAADEDKPLREAARCFQTVAVQRLLEHGTDPNQGNAISHAAAAGSLEIVRTLLRSGASLHAGSPPPIISAVRLEHVAMFNLLREHGGLEVMTKVAALEEASKNGLDSMVALLDESNSDVITC